MERNLARLVVRQRRRSCRPPSKVEIDDAAPYRADFPFLTRDENRALGRHADLTLVQAWPRPTITLGMTGSEPARVIGSDRPADPVTVVLRKVGFAQIWWSARSGAPQDEAPVGLIWEAVLDTGPDALLTFLWDRCEALLERVGARLLCTTHATRITPTPPISACSTGGAIRSSSAPPQRPTAATSVP